MSRRKSMLVVSQETQNQLKIQEDQLSNEIDQNIRTLALIHPLCESALQSVAKGAFLKPNKLAFHHIVHYLIMIINATEFRKRFRWPVVTSRDEADFRVTALSYFNECNKNYKWNIGPFKMQVVLFPGGAEFMKIIAELSVVAMRTVIKENDAMHILNSNGSISLQAAQKKLNAAQEAYNEMEQFCSKINAMSADLKSKTKRLQDLFRRLLGNTSIPETKSYQEFLTVWESNQLKTIHEKILPSLNELEAFCSKCVVFEKKLEDSKPQQLIFDKDKMKSLGFVTVSQTFTHEFNYTGLFQWFIKTMPEIMNSLCYKPIWSLSQLKDESRLLDRYLIRANNLIGRIDALATIDQLMLMDPSLHREATDDDIANENVKSVYWKKALVLTPQFKCTTNKDRVAIWELMQTIESPYRVVKSNFNFKLDDCTGLSDGIGTTDISTGRIASSKLDPMSMLNQAMQRIKPKASPRRGLLASSPSRLHAHSSPVHNSTMLTSPTIRASNISRINFPSSRKSLF